MSKNQNEQPLQRSLTSDSTVTSFKLSSYPNQDFVAVTEQKIAGRYYISVSTHDDQGYVKIPEFFISNDNKPTINTIDGTTSPQTLSSDSPMYPVVDTFDQDGFVIACFQKPYNGVVVKKFDSSGYSTDVFFNNTGLGVFYPVLVNGPLLPSDSRWENNVDNSLSLVTFPDKRFLIGKTTEMSPVHLDPIGLPTNRYSAPQKVSPPYKAVVTASTYSNNANLVKPGQVISEETLDGAAAGVTRNTMIRLDDTRISIAYYLTEEMRIIVQNCEFGQNAVITGCTAPVFSKQLSSERNVVKLALYDYAGFTFPQILYEVREPIYNNWQIRLAIPPDVFPNGITDILVSTDNCEGLYHDINPVMMTLKNGYLQVSWHRYNVGDSSSYGLMTQLYDLGFNAQFCNPSQSQYCLPQPFRFDTDHSQDTYSLGNFNEMSLFRKEGFVAAYWVDEATGLIYPPFPVASDNTLTATAPASNTSQSLNNVYILGSLAFTIGILTLLKIGLYYSKRGFSYQSIPADNEQQKSTELTLLQSSQKTSKNRYTTWGTDATREKTNAQIPPSAVENGTSQNYHSCST
ncbi:MAG: hypothetical protein NXI01_08890 [Gammaproteobacteria bacterium]|nr:hypothetical protein [Gammaproteobacteria bacterium]